MWRLRRRLRCPGLLCGSRCLRSGPGLLCRSGLLRPGLRLQIANREAQAS
jgi:hypothetical protein